MSGPGVPAKLRAAVLRWADADVDPADAQSLRSALESAESDPDVLDDLRDAFTGGLTFGTAGLRGAMGPGPNRMNRVVVARAAAGLAAYLTGEVESPLVVVGFDARHRSAQFADDSAEVMAGAGCRVVVLAEPLPTPVLAHAVRALGADAGVMVTASHNPKDDNGYKVYLGGRVSPDPGAGVQIVPPADGLIAARIDAAPEARELPRTRTGVETAADTLVEGYVAAVAGLLEPGARGLRIVTTAMHGVGDAVVSRVLSAAGFAAVTSVAEQAVPDPEFPTVVFPNPEEAGALDLALALAARTEADVVLANDPDADRCSVAVPDPSRGPRDDVASWRQLSGDEVGALLAEHVLTRSPVPTPVDAGEPTTLACSLVSSSLLHRIADHHGVRSASTLTGFKWIARVPGLVMGYEEALGYCVAPHLVRDKDGISAGLLVAELAARLSTEGRGLLDALDELHVRHGVHATGPVTLRLADLEVVGPLLQRVLTDPPGALVGEPVADVEDLAAGVDGLPGTPGVRLSTAGGTRVVVRPSGTEPKLKAYLEVVETVGSAGLSAAREVAADRLSSLTDEVRALLDG